MKKCTKCGVEKDESEFSRGSGKKDGLSSWCKKCSSEYNKEYRLSNHAHLIEASRAYRGNNRERLRLRQNEWRMANRHHILSADKEMRAGCDAYKRRTMIYAAKARAKKLGLPFDLTTNDILIPALCPVLGTEMSRSGLTNDPRIASLDRVIPSLGYIKGNVCVITRRANQIKNDATIEELELVLAYMKRHAAQQEQQEQGPEPCNT